MPGTHNRTHQPPANARVRRAAHLERSAAAKARKRQRTARAEIHRAIEQAIELSTNQTILVSGPFSAPDIKQAPHGWVIVGANGQLAKHSQSRDKARSEAKRLNDKGVPAVERTLGPAMTREEALESLGWRQVYDDGGKIPVERKLKRVMVKTTNPSGEVWLNA